MSLSPLSFLASHLLLASMAHSWPDPPTGCPRSQAALSPRSFWERRSRLFSHETQWQEGKASSKAMPRSSPFFLLAFLFINRERNHLKKTSLIGFFIHFIFFIF